MSVYTRVGGLPTFLGGYTSRDAHWADSVWWLIWMKSRMESTIWSSMRGSRRFTNGLLFDALTEAFQGGVRNGGIRPGQVDAATKADIIQTTGNDAFDGYLTTGYLAHIVPPSVSDVENRIGRFKAWAKGAPAIHEVFGDLTFAN